VLRACLHFAGRQTFSDAGIHLTPDEPRLVETLRPPAVDTTRDASFDEMEKQDIRVPVKVSSEKASLTLFSNF
jgi:hypothetical protein